MKLLYNILTTARFRKVLEIGCYNGASTSAFVQAINDGANFELHLCDPHFRDGLKRTVGMCKRRVFLHERRSLDVIDRSFDFIFVDGDHSYENVREEVALLLKHNVRSVVAHDTHEPHCEGSVYLAETYRASRGHLCLEDALPRPGEWTHRGFFFATRDFDVYTKVKGLFEA